MKVFAGFFIVGLAAATVAAQDTPVPPSAPVALAQAVKVNAELAAARGSAIKNSPFSAEEVNESVQTLFDGNRIVHSSTSKIYRNSEGRTRRESKGGAGLAGGFTYTLAPSISIVDPILRQKYELESTLKAVTNYQVRSGQDFAVAGSGATVVADQRATEEMLAKLKAEGKLDKAVAVAGAQGGAVRVGTLTGTLGDLPSVYTTSTGSFATPLPVAIKSRYETKTEELGTRDFEGVTAEGSRRTTIIPAGAIGNDRPIETVYERWYSKELGMVVYSKTIDPRVGEQTYKLTNIVRAEPDPSLFSLPTQTRKVVERGANYSVTPTTKAEPTRPIAARSTITPRVVSNQASGIKP